MTSVTCWKKKLKQQWLMRGAILYILNWNLNAELSTLKRIHEESMFTDQYVSRTHGTLKGIMEDFWMTLNFCESLDFELWNWIFLDLINVSNTSNIGSRLAKTCNSLKYKFKTQLLIKMLLYFSPM